MAVRRYRYRAYPTQEQGKYFQGVFGSCRFVYNWALALRTKSYEDSKARGDVKPKGLSSYDVSKELTKLKQEENTKWLFEYPAVAHNWALENLDTAFKNFFRNIKQGREAGYPQFKSKFKSQKAFSYHQGYDLSLSEQFVTVPKSGKLRLKIHRYFLGVPKTVTIIQEPSGKYYASIVVHDGTEVKETVADPKRMYIGVDVGVINTVSCSDGFRINLDLDIERQEKLLIRAQRQQSRKLHGKGIKASNNFRKAVKRVAIRHEKIRFKRKHEIERAAVALLDHIRTNDIYGICIRKYDVKSMVDRDKVEKEETGNAVFGARMVKRRINKKIMGGALGMCCTQLKQKLRDNGINVIEFPAEETLTTGKCNSCKSTDVEVNIKGRVLECKNCGVTADMDFNAAKNVLEYGLKTLEPQGKKQKVV